MKTSGIGIALRTVLLKIGFRPTSPLWEMLWKFSRLLFQLRNFFLRSRSLTVQVGDIAFQLTPDGAAAAGIWLGMKMEFEEIEFVLEHIKPGMTFVDIGSNAGVFSLAVATKMRDGHIYAFEPSPWTFRLLQDNIRLNSLEGIIAPQQIALADYAGEAVLNVNDKWKDDLNTLGRPDPWYSRIKSQLTIPVTTLDAFARAEGIHRLDILKVDVEGAELLVFRGATTWLEREDAPLIVYESYSWLMGGFNYKPQDAMRFLHNYGYLFFEFSKSEKHLLQCDIGHHDKTLIAVKPSHSAFGLLSR